MSHILPYPFRQIADMSSCNGEKLPIAYSQFLANRTPMQEGVLLRPGDIPPPFEQ